MRAESYKKVLVRRSFALVPLAALLATAGVACNTARPLRPLAQGAFGLDLSLPATFLRTSAATFPVGNLVLGGRYGVRDDIEVSLHLHPATLVTGTLTFEIGATWHIWPTNSGLPALHLGSHVLVATNFPSWGQGAEDAVRGVFELEVVAHWEPLQWFWPYIVLEDAIVLADGTVVASAIVGLQSWITQVVAISVEAGIAGFGLRSSDITATYVGIGGHGGLWIGLALSCRFEGSTRDATERSP